VAGGQSGSLRDSRNAYSLQMVRQRALNPQFQFPGEAETLLPPLCMLQVLRERDEEDTTGAFRWEDRGQAADNKQARRVRLKEIHVCACSRGMQSQSVQN
jgi:hypothetical protein